MKRVRAWSSQFSYTELYDCQQYYYEVPSCYSTVYLSGTVIKLGWTTTVNGAIVCVLTSTFKGKECGRCKLESAHHSGSPYLYLPDMMGNDSFLPSLFTKPRSTPKISITTSHWTGRSITHHLDIWIETGGLRPWTNSPTYVAPPLSTIRYSSLMDKIVTSTIAP